MKIYESARPRRAGKKKPRMAGLSHGPVAPAAQAFSFTMAQMDSSTLAPMTEAMKPVGPAGLHPPSAPR